MNKFKLNDRVLVIGKNTKGKIAFFGKTHFAEGEIYGVVLDEPKGKYNGTIGDVCYFECPENHATFVRACQLRKDVKSSSESSIAPVYPNYLKDSSSKHSITSVPIKEVNRDIANPVKNKSPNSQIHKGGHKEDKDISSSSENLIARVHSNDSSCKHEINVIQKQENKPKFFKVKKPSKLPELNHQKNLKVEKGNKSSSEIKISTVFLDDLKDSSSINSLNTIAKREMNREVPFQVKNKPSNLPILGHKEDKDIGSSSENLIKTVSLNDSNCKHEINVIRKQETKPKISNKVKKPSKLPKLGDQKNLKVEKGIRSSSEANIATVYPNDLKGSSSINSLKTIPKREMNREVAVQVKNKPPKTTILEQNDNSPSSKHLIASVSSEDSKDSSSKSEVNIIQNQKMTPKIVNRIKKSSKLPTVSTQKNLKEESSLEAKLCPNDLKDSSSKTEINIIQNQKVTLKTVNRIKKSSKLPTVSTQKILKEESSSEAKVCPNDLKESSSEDSLKTIQKSKMKRKTVTYVKNKPSKLPTPEKQINFRENKISFCSQDNLIALVNSSELKDVDSKDNTNNTSKQKEKTEIANLVKKTIKSPNLENEINFKEKESNKPSGDLNVPVFLVKNSSSRNENNFIQNKETKISAPEKKSSKSPKFDHSENFEEGKDLIKPCYPNNLKDNCSKHDINLSPKVESKEEITHYKKKLKKTQLLDSSVGNSKPSHQEKYQMEQNHRIGDVNFNKTEEFKKSSEDLETKIQNLDKVLEELSVLKQKLSERNKKIDGIRIYLRKLKTYMKWSQDIKKNSDDEDCNAENFTKLIVDNVLQQIEDKVDQIPDEINEDVSSVSEENSFLRLYVAVLEKRNAVLSESLTQARNILQQAYIHYRSKKKCKCVGTFDGVKIECKYCSPKMNSLAQSIEQTTRLFLETNPIKRGKSIKDIIKEFEEFAGSEETEKFMTFLAPNKAVKTYSKKGFQQSNFKAETFDSNKDPKHKSAMNSGGIQRLTQSATETNILTRPKICPRNHNRNARNKTRSTSLTSFGIEQTKRNPENLIVCKNIKKRPYKNMKETYVKSGTNTEIVIQESVSEVKPGVSDMNKSIKGSRTELLKNKEAKFTQSESNLNKAAISWSNMAKQETTSRRFKSERSVKRSQSENARKSTKKEPFRF